MIEDPRIGQTLGVWRLRKQIGSGGMSEVYLAYRIDGVVDQCAAVKILRVAYQPSVPDEADLLAPLQHQNIVRLFHRDVTDDGHRYLAMEYVEGHPITEYADLHGLSIHERLSLFQSVCQAIEFVHSRFIAHLDLKPANILVNPHGTVKLIDFGVALNLEGAKAVGPARALSVPYASPEQVSLGNPLSIASDVYSLGAVLYELLSGHPPFDPFLAPGEMERQILEEIPRRPSNALAQPRLRQIDSEKYVKLEPEKLAAMRGGCRLGEASALIAGGLDRICLMALRKESARRYKKAAALREDVELVLDGRRPKTARLTTPLFRLLRFVQRTPLPVYAVVFAILASYGRGYPGGFVAAARYESDNTSRVEEAIDSTVRELRDELRPQLTQDPRLQESLSLVDQVERAIGPRRVDRTVWDRMRHYFESSWRYNHAR